MKELYENQIAEKEKEIERFNNAEGDDLYLMFSEEEKIKNIKIQTKKTGTSTKANTVDNI